MGLLKKGTKLYSILKLRCPHCHEGDFFVSNNPYNLKHAGDLKPECDVCGKKFSKEPGFYYGAMYIAYGLGVAVFVAVTIVLALFFPNASTSVYIAAIVLSMLIGGPYFYALSKIIWANIFFKYSPPPSKTD